MPVIWSIFEREAGRLYARREFDHIVLSQIWPNNLQNYDGTVRPSILRSYGRPITVPIENVIRLTDDELERTEGYALQNGLAAFRHRILFECSSRSGQSFITPDLAQEVARLQQMLGEQFLDMRRALERGDELRQPCRQPRDQDIGEPESGFLRRGDRRGFRRERALMHMLDHGAEQRFLGFEVMIQRLPRQACGFRGLLDRRTPKAVPAEHQHGGIEDAVAGPHLTILTKLEEMSNNGFVSHTVIAGDLSAVARRAKADPVFQKRQ